VFKIVFKIMDSRAIILGKSLRWLEMALHVYVFDLTQASVLVCRDIRGGAPNPKFWMIQWMRWLERAIEVRLDEGGIGGRR